MHFRAAIVLGAMTAVGMALSGCATGGSSGTNSSFMSQCEANATTQEQRNECAWKNAERNAGGR